MWLQALGIHTVGICLHRWSLAAPTGLCNAVSHKARLPLPADWASLPGAASQFHSAARIPLRFLPRKPTSAVGSSQLWSGAVGSCTLVETRVESGLFWLHMLVGGKEYETRTASLALHLRLLRPSFCLKAVWNPSQNSVLAKNFA